ncbi:MAG TPA: DUF790 family protein [Ktedonobacterales bacterium]|nr:DUF790 family protein [Ktedonobacterales bacterium]
MVVQLFGDHKLARCLVECLAPWYRYRTRTLSEELSDGQLAVLARCGITNPSEMRLWLFRRANAVGRGFVSVAERSMFIDEAAIVLSLCSEQIDRLATLDAAANAVLVRVGAVPMADEVMARFNFETVAALLANAKLVRIALAYPMRDAPDVRELCKLAGVRADLDGSALVLHGRQDALNSWTRHGKKLAMLLALLLAFGLPARAGEATVAAPGDVEWQFRFEHETLRYFGATELPTVRSGTSQIAEALAAWRVVDTIATEFPGFRRTHGADGWTMRFAPDALVAEDGIIPSLLFFIRGNWRVPVALAPGTKAGQQCVAQLADRRPLVQLVSTAPDLTSRVPSNATSTASTALARWLPQGEDYLASLPALLGRAIDYTERQTAVAQSQRVFAAALRVGALAESRIAEWLSCGESDVATYLLDPILRAHREQVGLKYIEGFGLCSAAMLDRAQVVAADVAQSHGDEPVGHAWTVRVLGRKLREVTGLSEGIECLIAYLGAA